MFSLVLAAALSFTQADADFAYRTAGEFSRKCTPRDAGTIRGRIAANYILDTASAAGADVRLDVFEDKTPNGYRKFTNLEAEFSASAAEPWVIFVSHYDTKLGVNCPGANDGASSTALLIALAQVLAEWDSPRGNVMLIWTDGEECMKEYGPGDGLWGARRAVSRLQKANRQVKAVICLDMVGDRDLQLSMPMNTSPVLRKIVHHAAKKVGLSHKVKDMTNAVTDDHVPFVEADYKAVTLIDFEYGSAPGKNDYWHTPNDTIDKISAQSLLETGKIATELLNILLPKPPPEERAATGDAATKQSPLQK